MSTEPLIAASHSGTPRSSLLASRGSDPHYLVGPCTADETAASRDLHSTPSATDNRLDGNAVTRSGGEAVGGRPRGTDNSPSSDDLETDFVVDGDAPVGGNAVAPSQGSSLRLHLLVSTVFVFASGAIALLVTDLGIVLSVRALVCPRLSWPFYSARKELSAMASCQLVALHSYRCLDILYSFAALSSS